MEGDITVAILTVTGDIPADADYTVEVTNNANDSSPVWQDVTTEVKNGTNIVFENHENTNGAAFNFRITVDRGGLQHRRVYHRRFRRVPVRRDRPWH